MCMITPSRRKNDFVSIAISRGNFRMPAKKRNDPKYKSFLGRIFSIRKHKVIPASRTESGERLGMTPNQLGEAVLVLDENNTRVKVCVAEGGVAWIPKFYLHEEMTNSEFHSVDDLTETIQELLSLAESIRLETVRTTENGFIKREKLEPYSKELQRLANDLRQFVDRINPTSKAKRK